ncbi:MAG: S53 family peptidase [Mycobacterium sp.]|nr:S53 family peptidase [Mycobacterium sp.]
MVLPSAGPPLARTGRLELSGPLARLLSASVDLGPSAAEHVELTAALSGAARPAGLIEWARTAGLSVQWRPGEDWATVEGPARAMAAALRVELRDYRGRRGQIFYAATSQPKLPQPLVRELTGFGRLLGYTPFRQSRPLIVPRDVPAGGLAPPELRRAYHADVLADEGFTGKGRTIVIFGFDGFDQSDLDKFADLYRLPRFTPVVVGDMPSQRTGETTMDLEIAHAIAPDARMVYINARPTVSGDGAYRKIGEMMADADRRFPGAVWSFSIGWGCDKLLTAADLAPARSALAQAHRRGTTAFDASGDLAGLECKGGQDWSAPPSVDDIGLDSVASLPEMTAVGGTTLSTDERGGWLGERAWFDVPLTHGSGGGTSALFDRPAWQLGVPSDRGKNRRLIPDVAAVADFFTGARIVFGGDVVLGGGTSMAAPLWAGIAAVIDQWLLDNGGRLLGDLNPMLYRLHRAGTLPAFRDVTIGGNAVAMAGPGYDSVTGLGTPDVENLARSLLLVQGTSG